VSGLVLVTGAADGGPGPGCRRMAGLLLDRGVPVRAFARTQDHRAEHLRQPGAKVAAGDPREIADVEPGTGNNRAAGTATAPGFPNSDARLRVPADGWSAPAERVAGAGGLLPGLPAVLLGSSSGKCSQARCAACEPSGPP
jgi:hypothetical protein